MRLTRKLSVLILVAGVVLGVAGGIVAMGFPYRFYVVHTGSMMPTYVPGDVVIDRIDAPVQPGEVVTFKHSAITSDLVTHRVTDVADGTMHTKGDANRTADVWVIPLGWVQGVVTGHVPYLGYLIVYLKQPPGLGSVLTTGLGLSLLWSLFFPGVPAPAPVDPDPSPAATARTRSRASLLRLRRIPGRPGRHRSARTVDSAVPRPAHPVRP